MALSSCASHVLNLLRSCPGPKPCPGIPRAPRPCGLVFFRACRWQMRLLAVSQCEPQTLKALSQIHTGVNHAGRKSAELQIQALAAEWPNICLSLDHPTFLWTRLTLCMGKQVLPRMCLQSDMFQRYFQPAFGLELWEEEGRAKPCR